MKKHIEQAKSAGLNWQAALLEDAQSDINLVIKQAALGRLNRRQIEQRIDEIIKTAVDELESEALKGKARELLYALANQQYRTVQAAFRDVPLWMILPVYRGTASKTQITELARTLQTSAAKNVLKVPQEITTQMIRAPVGKQYIEIAQPLRKWVHDYMRDNVRPVMNALATSDARDETGGFVNLRHIAEMTVRYEHNMERVNGLRDSGVEFAWISSHANCSQRCEPWQGKLYNFRGKTGTLDGIPYVPIERAMDVYYTTRAGKTYRNGCLSGFGCRHELIPYKRGNKPYEVDAKTVAKYRAIDQTQRSYERRILHEREYAAVWKGIDNRAYTEHRKRAAELYEAYKRYSRDNNVAYYPARQELFPD